jgi:hypothetical protein
MVFGDVAVAPEVFPNAPGANDHDGRDIRAPIYARGGVTPSSSLDAKRGLPNNHEPTPYQILAP